MAESEEAWNQGSVNWGSREGILEKELGNYHDAGNYEQEKETNRITP